MHPEVANFRTRMSCERDRPSADDPCVWKGGFLLEVEVGGKYST